jgi:hypothetical protein
MVSISDFWESMLFFVVEESDPNVVELFQVSFDHCAFLFSQLAIALRVSWRRRLDLITSTTGIPMVKISMKKIDKANHAGGTSRVFTAIICGA